MRRVSVFLLEKIIAGVWKGSPSRSCRGINNPGLLRQIERKTRSHLGVKGAAA
jgi:hypothetical protein